MKFKQLGRVLIAVGAAAIAVTTNALTIDVQKARKDDILNTEEIVTNVTFDLDLPYGAVGRAGLVQPLSVNTTNQSGIVFANNGTIYVNAESEYGLYRTASGKLAVSAATFEDYEEGTSWYKPITPAIMGDILDPFANRVEDPVEGNFASLDADGDLADSGYSFKSFAPSNTVVYKVEGATNDNLAVFAADGSIKDTGVRVSQFATAAQGATADNAIPKIPGATNDHFVVVAEGGVVKDSGYTASSFSASGHTHVWSEVTDRPTNVSSFNNDAGYVTKSVTNDLSKQVAELESRTNDWNEVKWSEVKDRPTAVSEFSNDANYITTAGETDPTVYDWAKAERKPSYAASEVGVTLTNDTDSVSLTVDGVTTRFYYWALSTTKPSYFWDEINNRPTGVSAFINDVGYLTSESDPSVHAWAKAETKPSYTWTEIGNRPTNVSDFTNDENYIKLTEFKQAILAAVTNDIPVITDEGDGFTEEQLVRSINELAGALNRLRAAALEP